jgi:XisI protein
MDRIKLDLATIVQREIEDYADGNWWQANGYAVCDPVRHIYTAIVVPDYEYPRKQKVGIVVMARVVANMVIIDEDTTDRPLYKELMRAGIPREQIILAYTGETLPQTSQENP